MKILVITPNPGVGEWGIGLLYTRAFRALGHDVDLHPIDYQSVRLTFEYNLLARVKRIPPLCSYLRKRLEERLTEKVKRYNPDMTLVTRCETLSEEAIGELKRHTKQALLNIYTDSPMVFPGPYDRRLWGALRVYDTVLTFGQNLTPIFYQLGAKRVEWLPFAYDPDFHQPRQLGQEDAALFRAPVAYIGAYGPLQAQWLTPLVPLGLTIWGVHWHHLPYGHPLRACWQQSRGYGEEMWKPIVGAGVVFNLVRAEHGCSHSMKTFEIPACGGMMITNRSHEQLLFFKEGKDAVFFDGQEEALDKVRFYIAHEAERERIRQSGLKAVAPHSYASRASALVKYVESGEMPRFV